MISLMYIFEQGGVPLSVMPDGSSFEIILPEHALEGICIDENDLDLWVSEAIDDELVLVSKIQVEAIEKILNGRLSGNICLFGAQDTSTHFRRLGSAIENFSINFLKNLYRASSNGLCFELSAEQVAMLDDVEIKTWKTSFLQPDRKKIQIAIELWNEKYPYEKMGELDAIKLIKKIFPQSQLSRSKGDPESFSPSDSYAFAVYETFHGPGKLTKQDDFKKSISQKKITSSKSREIDNVLRNIESGDLASRTFLWCKPGEEGFDWTESLLKTERAEKRHQEILADCFNYLISVGVTPLMNGNVDLAYMEAGGLTLFEIKSATAENLRSQVLKGAIQIIEYALSFECAHHVILRKVVIIESPENFLGTHYYVDLLKSMGVEVVFYDSKCAWPMRALGLISL